MLRFFSYVIGLALILQFVFAAGLHGDPGISLAGFGKSDTRVFLIPEHPEKLLMEFKNFGKIPRENSLSEDLNQRFRISRAMAISA